jgi:hypothetical protein
VVDGLASIIVIWRFTGSRTRSLSSERAAQRAVAVSFWLLARYIAIDSLWALVTGHRPEHTLFGIASTASSFLVMPGLG